LVLVFQTKIPKPETFTGCKTEVPSSTCNYF